MVRAHIWHLKGGGRLRRLALLPTSKQAGSASQQAIRAGQQQQPAAQPGASGAAIDPACRFRSTADRCVAGRHSHSRAASPTARQPNRRRNKGRLGGGMRGETQRMERSM
eukprot:350259-Chlamydomonas_euryale.AAC.2